MSKPFIREASPPASRLLRSLPMWNSCRMTEELQSQGPEQIGFDLMEAAPSESLLPACCCTMRFEINTKVQARCMLKHHRISMCAATHWGLVEPSAAESNTQDSCLERLHASESQLPVRK